MKCPNSAAGFHDNYNNGDKVKKSLSGLRKYQETGIIQKCITPIIRKIIYMFSDWWGGVMGSTVCQIKTTIQYF